MKIFELLEAPMKFTVVTRVRPNSISIRGYRVGNKRVLTLAQVSARQVLVQQMFSLPSDGQIKRIGTLAWARQHLSKHDIAAVKWLLARSALVGSHRQSTISPKRIDDAIWSAQPVLRIMRHIAAASKSPRCQVLIHRGPLSRAVCQ